MQLARTTKSAVATAIGLTTITAFAITTTGEDAQKAPVTVASTSSRSLVLEPADLIRRDRSSERASRSRTAAAATALQARQAAAAAAAAAAKKRETTRAADAAAAKEAERRAAVHQAAHAKAKRDRTARDRAAAARRAAASAAARTAAARTDAASPAPAPVVAARASSSSSGAGRGALAEAPNHQGTPYEYGATGPDSFDCSGFTQYLFARQGTQLPRVSRDQYAASTKVDKGAKQPGDLIFTYGSNGIYHVGIYAGDNTMWAATKTGDVVRRQAIWTTQYYVGRFS